MTGEIKDGKTIPMGVKIAIWVTCAALYVTQVSAVFYRLHNASGSNIWTYVGAVIMLFGVILESAADLQKNAAKKVNPKRFVGLRKFTLGFNELESTHRNSDNVSGTESQLHYTPN